MTTYFLAKKHLILGVVISMILVMVGWIAGARSRHPLPPQNVLEQWPIDLKQVIEEVEDKTGWKAEFDFASEITPPGTWDRSCSILVHPPGDDGSSRAATAVHVAIQNSLKARGYQIQFSNRNSCKIDCSYLYENATIRGELSIKKLLWQKGVMLVLHHEETSAAPLATESTPAP